MLKMFCIFLEVLLLFSASKKKYYLRLFGRRFKPHSGERGGNAGDDTRLMEFQPATQNSETGCVTIRLGFLWQQKASPLLGAF